MRKTVTMNIEDKIKLQDLIVKQTEEIYKLRSELQEKDLQIKALRSEKEKLARCLEQSTASNKTSVSNAKAIEKDLDGSKYAKSEEELKKKYEGTATMAPYYFYRKRCIDMPEWAKQCYQLYRSKKKECSK